MPILTGFDLPMVVTLADCLFHLNPSHKLVPVAIRLEYRNGGDLPTYWYPPPSEEHEFSPSYLSWLLAKMYFRSADMQVCGVYTIDYTIRI